MVQHILPGQNRPVARIDRGGGWNPKYVDILDPKSGLFEPHSLNPLTNTHFLPILWLTVELLAWGGCVAPTTPPGYGPGSKVAVNVTDSCGSEVLSKELVTSLILIVEIMKRFVWVEIGLGLVKRVK